ncbi:hypothetical protein LIER_19719 [Lithospermum erythrorhizon]|uniref:Reverse transcriptase domain-containing protein n=1 Tax=Lithospermum erythrorhizon TaxID=34254 RepID=A0AAV3QLC4_LITER
MGNGLLVSSRRGINWGQFWTIVGRDTTDMVLEVLNGANRLKTVLPDIISGTQSAYTAGRLITDNVLMAFEAHHSLKRKRSREHLIQLIKEYVNATTYAVMVNGEQSGFFTPSRGLRQGDPLCPYLFILVTEGLISLSKKAQNDGLIHGLRIGNMGPIITHLLFVDDCVLFDQASGDESRAIKQVLMQYELASGQRVNFNKSSICFSPNINAAVREEIMQILEVEEVASHGKYLGLPTVVGRSKIEVFASITDRVRKKLQGWQAKSLSKAGKKVLLKSAVQAIPNYAMQWFKLPLNLCHEIESMMAESKRKLHWVAWANQEMKAAWDLKSWSISTWHFWLNKPGA